MRLILLLIGTLLLTACNTVPIAPVNHDVWHQTQNDLNTLNTWKISGSLVARSSQAGETVNYVWLQQGNRYEIQLSGPLGVGATEISGDPSQVTLQRADGKRATAANAETLLQQQLGWSLPLTNLVYWIRGIPVPQVQSEMHYDKEHRVFSIMQQGWDIHYLSFMTVKGYNLPKLIALTSHNLYIKIAIHNWNIR